MGASCVSLSLGVESGWRVVDDDTESSGSDAEDPVGEIGLPEDEEEGEVLTFLDRTFCVILV
jgi:hypothetical protein